MARPWEFQLPTRILFGRGALRKLGRAAGGLGRSVFLVGYADTAPLAAVYHRAERLLAEADLRFERFYGVPPDPEADLVCQGAERARSGGAEVVIGLGGGSVIDAAKGIAALARMGGKPWDYAGANPDGKPVTESLPVVAVPTTAGTGSEVSAVAVFTHRGVGSNPDVPLKASISGPAIQPAVALVDPDLATGSPPQLTASCGADALGHAIEASVSRRANPVASLLAARAVALIVGHLPPAVNNPDDPGPREPLALAATLAGAAFSQAGVVVTHAIAQALGAVLHVPHGAAVAVATPPVLRFNAPACVDPYAELAEACRITADSAQAKASRFVETIANLLRAVGLPQRVRVPRPVDDQLVDELVQNARESTPVPITLNPSKVDDCQLAELFRQVLCSGR